MNHPVNRPTSNFIVIRNANGEDVVWGGVVNGQHIWTWQADKMRRLPAGLACELLRDFTDLDCGDGPRVVVGDADLGPYLQLVDHQMICIGGGVEQLRADGLLTAAVA